MNELLMALGLQLAIDEISIKVQTFKVFMPGSTGPQISSSGVWTLGSQYTYAPVFIPTSIWYYQTEFGQQLEKYNAARAQSYQIPYNLGQSITGIQGIISSQPGQVITTTGSGTFGGLYGGIAGQLGGSIQQQQAGMSQQHALQQAAAQAQAKYPITISTPYMPPGQLIMQSPTSQVKITNIQDSDEEDKKSWVTRIKEWVSGTTS